MVLGSSPPTRTRRRWSALVAATVLVIGPALTACGDDGGGGTDDPPPTPSKDKTTSAPADPTSASPSEEAPGGGQPEDPAAAEKEIKTNFAKFFDPKVSMAEKEKVLENGTKMRPVLQAFSGDERGQQTTAEVKKVTFTSPTAANVAYDLSLNGAVVLPGAAGAVVEQDGTWKVSVKTLCGLLAMSGSTTPLPGC
ncbi:hypothetical protein H9Y04_22375 [Streptomyces sp. TRM66268-LWL]|uniref:Low molecular weight antigen MTB12-like C-terminal domain-containing protein n=1 Tax=Streptomyces polyasparticus TaxID=2767826 RepID=A0ABR7SLB9_9ACTN|nr:hypothetical protein [Streptomyces polyasparticus]MBC9715301.1 hypothetical protein [Streptomyces polyasparticus]